MPIKFDHYRFVDGRTPLSAGTFNGVFRDLDLRTAALEDLRVNWEASVAALNGVGLERIDGTLAPLLAQIQSDVAAAQAQVTLLAQNGLTQIEQTLAPVLSQLQSDANIAAQLVASLDPNPAVAITYNANGTINTVTATFRDATTEVQTMGYDVIGRLATVTSVLGGVTQLTAITYAADGQINGMVTETL